MPTARPLFASLLAIQTLCSCGGCGDGATSAAQDLAAPQPTADLAGADLAGADLAGTPPQDFASSATDGPAPGGPPQAATQLKERYFPDDAPWYRDISNVPVAADSNAITQWMVGFSPPGGWGNRGVFQVDFSIIALEVPAGTPKQPHTALPDYHFEPDCDTAPVPFIPGGLVEENKIPGVEMPFSGYACQNLVDWDCHILLVARSERRLYETWKATWEPGTGFRTGCLAIWDMSRNDPKGRGDGCTSADAAGFPMAPLLFTVEELAAGEIRHAIRFILPNNMIRMHTYVAPATHTTRTTMGPATSGPYGFRMRLKADYPINNLNKPAQVVARALQKYGMLMSDGGQVAVTAQSDALSSVKYKDLGFGPRDLAALKATDFEVIEDTPVIKLTDTSCGRKMITK